MIPTVEQVYIATRAIVGDIITSTGQTYTDSVLKPHYIFAFSELFRAMQSAQNPRVRKESYYNLPQNTSYLNPATAFIFNMGEPESVEGRKNITTWALSSFTTGNGIATIVTTTPTTLNSGQQVVLYGVQGVTDDANDQWTITVVNPNTIQLNGCTAVAVDSPDVSQAVLSYSTEQFLELTPVPRISWEDRAPVDRPLEYAWEGDVFRFPPSSSNPFQLRIVYSLSGDAPLLTTQSVGIDDSLGFLSYRTAWGAVYAQGMENRAKVYENASVGPYWISDSMPGGILQQLLLPGIRNLQGLPPSQRRSPPFGRSRNRRWMAW